MAKRKNANVNLNDALREFLQENRLEKGIDKVHAQEAWKKVMGNGVNKYTTAVELQDDVLYVALSSSVLREELGHGRSKIIAMLNEELGKDLIKKLVLR